MILIQLMELHFAGKRPQTDSTALCGQPDFSSLMAQTRKSNQQIGSVGGSFCT